MKIRAGDRKRYKRDYCPRLFDDFDDELDDELEEELKPREFADDQADARLNPP